MTSLQQLIDLASRSKLIRLRFIYRDHKIVPVGSVWMIYAPDGALIDHRPSFEDAIAAVQGAAPVEVIE